MTNSADNLVAVFQADVVDFVRRHGLSARKFSAQAGMSVNFYSRLTDGVVPSLATVQKVRSFMVKLDKVNGHDLGG